MNQNTKDAAGNIPVSITINGDGYTTSGSTPAIVHVKQISVAEEASATNETKANNANSKSDEKAAALADFYHAIDMNVENTVYVETPGEYEISYITPINEDGSIYKMPATMTISINLNETDNAQPANENTAAENKSVKKANEPVVVINENAEHIDASDVSAEDLESVKNAIDEALENGDNSLVSKKSEIEKQMNENIKNNPNVDSNENKANENHSDNGTVASEQPKSSNVPSQSGSFQASSQPQHSETHASEPAQPVHQHNWVTGSREVDTGRGVVVCQCGAQFSSTVEWDSHCISYINSGEFNNHRSYSVQPLYQTVYYQYCTGCGAEK